MSYFDLVFGFDLDQEVDLFIKIVESIMYGMEVITWSEKEIDKLKVRQNRVVRPALNAPRYAAVEALRDDMG